MANNFQLISKETNEAISLNLIDEQICNLIGSQVHDIYYGGTGNNSFNWFDSIGYQIASGKTLEQIREYYNTSDMWELERPVINKIITFLEEKYTTNQWYSWG